jgi:hypothetical protein
MHLIAGKYGTLYSEWTILYMYMYMYLVPDLPTNISQGLFFSLKYMYKTLSNSVYKSKVRGKAALSQQVYNVGHVPKCTYGQILLYHSISRWPVLVVPWPLPVLCME